MTIFWLWQMGNFWMPVWNIGVFCLFLLLRTCPMIFLLMVVFLFWTFEYHISNILQNVLIISVCCKHYANILFLRLLKALLLIYHKRSISKQIIAPSPCSVGTQACTKTKCQVLILQHELFWCFSPCHSNGISAVEKEWKIWFCLII